MKKENVFKPHNSNKGAALVSILIAVAFLSIISATMLLVSVNNYEMKITQSKSKKNFYQNELCVNVVTAKVRNEVLNQENPDKKIKNKVGGSDTATTYKAELIADLIDSTSTHTGSSGQCTFTNSDGYEITTYDGNISTFDKTTDASLYAGGVKVVLDDVKVEVKNPEGFKNKIETDISFYMQLSSSGGGGGTIGECSFLMDNSITVNDTNNPSRIQVYGNSIIGKYKLESGKSVGDTAISLIGNSVYRIVGDYTVIYGDVYIKNNSTLHIVRGNVSVFGNIYLQNNGALLCNGNLKLGPSSKILKGTDEITGTDKSKNVIITGSISHLTQSDEDSVRAKLMLNDSNTSNDGVLAQIIDTNSSGQYFYQLMNMQGQAASGINNFYFDGNQYTVSFYTQSDINTAHMFDYKLAFVYDNGGNTLYSSNKVTLDYSATNTTFISSRPLCINNTHSVNVSQMGKAQFNYVLDHDEIKVGGYSVNDYFIDNPNAVVSEIFNLANGSSGGTPKCINTAAGYSDWSKEY